MTTVYLTVDDAPSETLPEKLDLLAARGVPALLFCEGRRLADYPDRARAAVDAGHHLGNHTYSHRRASDVAVETFRDGVARTESLLDEAYGRTGATRPGRAFRFPYGDDGGDRAPAFRRVLDEWGFAPPDPTRVTGEWADGRSGGGGPPAPRDWSWTVDVEDWTVGARGELRTRVASAFDRLDGGGAEVVLFHDAGNDVDLFEAFLDALRDRGVDFADPAELLG